MKLSNNLIECEKIVFNFSSTLLILVHSYTHIGIIDAISPTDRRLNPPIKLVIPIKRHREETLEPHENPICAHVFFIKRKYRRAVSLGNA